MFLRNLCRVVKIPAFLSGTDSHVGKMIGPTKSSIGSSRTEPGRSKPWVNINVETSKASLESFSKLVKFKKHNENISSTNLTSFIIEGELDYVSLLKAVYGRDATVSELGYFKKLAEFLILQAQTSLSGIVPLVFSYLLELIPECSDPKELWKQLTKFLTVNISERKKDLIFKDGLLASSHILTFPSVGKKVFEDGVYAANLVENHLFYYGSRDDKTFQLDLQYDVNYFEDDDGDSEDEDSDSEDDDEDSGDDDEDSEDDDEDSENIILARNGIKYIDKCHFPELNEDFFTTFACLNMWNLGVINKDKVRKKRWTMASLYEDYLNSNHKYYVGVDKTVQNSFSLELLTYWSICRASHQNVNGEAGGVNIFWEFVKNLQKSQDSNGNLKIIKFKGLKRLDPNLQAILDKIKVPYLMRFPAGNLHESTQDLLKIYIGDFIEIGEASFPRDKFGWDVTFDMKFHGVPKTGLIECKLRAEAIGYAGFFDYYKKQCESNENPLAFLVCRKLGKEISDLEVEIKLEVKRVKIDDKNSTVKIAKKHGIKSNEKEPAEVVKTDYIALLNKMWEDPNNNVDIYTVKYEETLRKGNFIVTPLKTFLNPKGAFILVDTNFTPPASTNKS